LVNRNSQLFTQLIEDESSIPLYISISNSLVRVNVDVTKESLIDVENSKTPVLKSKQFLSTE
jgi:hypothetical protein